MNLGIINNYLDFWIDDQLFEFNIIMDKFSLEN